MSSAAVQWFTTEELVEEAMATASIVDLARWAAISRRFRSIIKGILQRRIKTNLTKFIPTADLGAFFAILDKTDSAIGGSVALSVLTPHCNWAPRDLNIMIPQSSRRRWLDFFHFHGYEGDEICLGDLGTWEHHRYPELQTTVATHVYRFEHPKLKRDIILIVSKSNTCMIPIIGSQTTSQMNAITSSHIYCLYPRLTEERVALRGYYAQVSDKYLPTSVSEDRRERLVVQGLSYYDSSSHLDRTCGIACADIERTLFGWRGVGILQWGGYEDSKSSESFLLPENTLHVAWQLGEWCDNIYCNMGRVF